MSDWTVQNQQFESLIRESFARQKVMGTIGALLKEVSPGRVSIRLPFREDLVQQHGYLHAGIVTTIVDSACGYAAYSLMPENSEVLAVEFKINLLSPAKGSFFVAQGQVLKSGRTLTVCEGKVFAYQDAKERLVAAMQSTMICIHTPTG